MSRINTNVSSMIAQRVLGQQNQALTTSLERLSTGMRINRGKDDPAGLIASENLRSEKTAIMGALDNASRAEQVMNVAEGGLQEVSALLVELQGLVTTTANSAGMSAEEKDAAQLQVDSILQTIDRIASATSFEGIKLLNGNFDYTVSSVASSVDEFEIRGAKLAHGDTLDVQVIVTQSAQTAGLFLSTNGALDLGTGSSFTIEIAGELGARELSFASGTTQAQIVAAINTYTDITGVSAKSSGTGILLRSNEYGDDAFTSVKVIDDGGIGAGSDIGIYGMQAGLATSADTSTHTDFSSATTPVKDFGQDVAASINGVTAVTDGRTARINTDFLDVEVTLDATSSGAGDVGSIDVFTVTGGGADFQLSPRVDIAGKVSVSLGDVAVRRLGSVGSGFLDQLGSGESFNLVDGDYSSAQKVVNDAIKQVSTTRGRLGAFQKNVVGATSRSLSVALENTSSAESVIRDTDFAAETASLTRAQILVNSSMNILSLANSQPQNVLTLLG